MLRDRIDALLSGSIAVGLFRLLVALTGIATLTFVSNILLGIALVRRRFVAFFLGLVATTIPPLLLAWPRTTSFFGWLTRYGGGNVTPRVEHAYGEVDHRARRAVDRAQRRFELAPVAGMLAARIRSRTILALGAFVLLWNVGDVTMHRILYPRQERIARS